ncbi:MAG: quinone-dependent dihydroorotate dehydrogenase, partial [Patescibacteria group bacterium]|nr:quinone-dependent dihydroorotate dehydrogenase [Patescibacteria group bacterium]
SLVVYYGLKNQGCEVISKRLQYKKFSIPIGISIAKTNSSDIAETQEGIEDYAKVYKTFTSIGSYFTINISCPNTYGGQPFSDPKKLDLLLKEISKIPCKKPIFLKLPPDLTFEEVDKILEVTQKHKVDGFICSNLTKNRINEKIVDTFVPDQGGISGKAVEKLADDLIGYIYQKTQGKYAIIGCGGVFSAEDAYKKIKMGASLVQLVTGMIFEGPQVISEINRGLVKLLQKDGYTNISQAVGRSHHDCHSRDEQSEDSRIRSWTSQDDNH